MYVRTCVRMKGTVGAPFYYLLYLLCLAGFNGFSGKTQYFSYGATRNNNSLAEVTQDYDTGVDYF